MCACTCSLCVTVYNRVNVLQGVYLTKFSIDHLRESHGTILAVSSMAGTHCSCSVTTLVTMSLQDQCHHQCFRPTLPVNMLSMVQYTSYWCCSVIYCTGYFSSLNMEFELRQENISIVIMPLPFVYTTSAVESLKPKSNLLFEPGITPKVSNTWPYRVSSLY